LGAVAGWPSVLIAVSWLGLWLLWPPVTAGPPRRREAPAVRSAYLPSLPADALLYRKPDVFGLPSSVGFRIADSDAGSPVPDVLPRYRRARARCLEMADGQVSVPPPAVAASDPVALEDIERAPFRWPTVDGFPPPAGTAAWLAVETDPALAQAGFAVPGLASSVSGLTDKAWEVDLSVGLDEDGSAEHVFLERRSGNTNVDHRVVRAVFGGRGRAGVPAAGSVTIRCDPR
jgi:hypothetical protein